MTGYSKTPLIKKLGIKESYKLLFLNSPNHFQSLLGPLPKETSFPSKGPYNYIHLFTNSISQLEESLPKLQHNIVSGLPHNERCEMLLRELWKFDICFRT